MQDGDKSTRPKLLPLIRYRDPARSIEWLCEALGFEKQHVVTRDDGRLSYAHLSFGGSLIMVTPIGEAVSSDDIKLPEKIGRAQGQSCYFVVRDVNAHYEKAKAAGAEIVLEVKVYEHGGCRYSCRDLEGHIWNFGTYDPWQPLGLTYHGREKPKRFTVAAPKYLAMAIGGLMVLSGACGAAWIYGSWGQTDEFENTAAAAPALVDQYAHLSPLSPKIYEAKRVATLQTVRDVTPQVAQAPATAVAGGAEIAAEQHVQEITAQLAHDQPKDGVAKKADQIWVHEQIDKGAAPLAIGQELMSRGELEPARKIFKQAANKGSPEGALALGSTYDPANLAWFGLADASSNRNEAKR